MIVYFVFTAFGFIVRNCLFRCVHIYIYIYIYIYILSYNIYIYIYIYISYDKRTNDIYRYIVIHI